MNFWKNPDEELTKKQIVYGFLIIILISLLCHLPYFSIDLQGHHAWRITQTGWNIRNFVRHDFNIFHPRVSHFNSQFEENLYLFELPLMQWLIASVQRITGESIWILRGCMFIIGTWGIMGMLRLATFTFGRTIWSLLTTFAFAFGPVYFYYMINPLPDVFALASGIWFIYFALEYNVNNKRLSIFTAAICLAISVLSKLPYIIFTIIPIYYFFKEQLQAKKVLTKQILAAAILLASIIPAFFWYKYTLPFWSDMQIVTGLFESSMSFGEFWKIFSWYLKEYFPRDLLSPILMIMFLAGIHYLKKSTYKKGWIHTLIGITLFYVIFEFKAIKTAHDYYLMPLLPWIYITLGFGIRGIWKNWNHGRTIVIVLLGLSPIYNLVALNKYWSAAKTPLGKDAEQHRVVLKNAVPDDALCIILNDRSHFIFSYQIDKMGFVFKDDDLPAAFVKDMIIRQGAEYMYSDSRIVDERKDIKVFLDSMIVEAGNIKVWKLVDKEDLK